MKSDPKLRTGAVEAVPASVTPKANCAGIAAVNVIEVGTFEIMVGEVTA